MRRLATAACGLLVLVFAFGCASKSAQYTAYGEPMKLSEKEQVSVAKVLAAPDQYAGKTILVSGVVSEVCLHKGCWINVAEKVGGQALFVKFTCPVEGRLIPMEALGQPTLVEGTLLLEEVPEDEARHYAEDAGKSEAEIAKIVGPQKRMRLQSPSARVAATPATEAKPEKG